MHLYVDMCVCFKGLVFFLRNDIIYSYGQTRTRWLSWWTVLALVHSLRNLNIFTSSRNTYTDQKPKSTDVHMRYFWTLQCHKPYIHITYKTRASSSHKTISISLAIYLYNTHNGQRIPANHTYTNLENHSSTCKLYTCTHILLENHSHAHKPHTQTTHKKQTHARAYKQRPVARPGHAHMPDAQCGRHSAPR